ncbi:hypothetical protein BDQ17DRAFT_628875 [Cyathus striatus]|nr:hypothetical protein BDQ17DRAFT_628875 [Cyathus striatus]
MVGKHVRRLRLVLLNETMPSTQSNPFRQVHLRKPSTARSSKQTFQTLIEALSASFLSMPKIEALYLRLGEVVPEYEDAMRVFFEVMWMGLGTQLKSLKLFATLCSFQLCIPPSPISLPLLEKLDMDFWDERHFLPHDTPDEEVLSGTISPFLNSLAPQLRSLNISTYVFSRDHHDITSLFQYLTHFPLLDSLGIQLISTRAERSDDIRSFIEKHVSQLCTLRLHTRCWQDDTLLFTLLSGCLPSPPSLPSASSSRIQLQDQPPLQLQLKTLDLYSYSFPFV